jgi:hypothetical protein
MPVKTVRRYYLRKSQQLYLMQYEGLAAAYRSKQDGVAGTPLPVAFPFLAKLAAARYTTREDLDGADVAELMNFASLNIKEATTVLKALAALP